MRFFSAADPRRPLRHWASGFVVEGGSRTDSMAQVLTGLAIASLPLQGFFGRAAHIGSALLFDWLCAAALLTSLPKIVRACRNLVAAAALRSLAALCAAAALSEWFVGQRWTAWLGAGEQVWALLVASLFAVHAQTLRDRERLLTLLTGVGAASAVVGLGGWLFDWGYGSQWFTFRSAHPVFEGIPRYLGTVASSPQRAGNLLVLQLGAIAALDGLRSGSRSKTSRCLLALNALALVATASFAWVGALVLLVGCLIWPGAGQGVRRRAARRGRLLAVAVLLAAAGVASYPMTFGQRPSEQVGNCQQVDAAHNLAVLQKDGQCRLVLAAGRTVPTYANAKAVAWEAWSRHWWVGVGYRRFPQFADRVFQQWYGAVGSHYRQPHGLYHGFAGKHGVCGLLGLLGALALWVRSFRSDALSWTVTAFLVIGLHFDVDRLRELWVCFGLVAGQQLTVGRAAAATAQVTR